jgi:hypothetical protein
MLTLTSDGEWQQCIVDDKLYLRAADYDESVDERPLWDDINRTDTEEEYRRVWQTGSRALYFAQCVDENEIWLPLLEKAFAKAHGDYSAIEGGFVGEAIEDLTGGVTSEVLSSNILNKDRFWTEELMKVNEEFLFGCGTGLFSNWLDPQYRGPPRDRKGISEQHSYSIMEAREIDGHRLLRLRYGDQISCCEGSTCSHILGILGVGRSGTVPGAMDPKNGQPSGLKNLDISSAMMG